MACHKLTNCKFNGINTTESTRMLQVFFFQKKSKLNLICSAQNINLCNDKLWSLETSSTNNHNKVIETQKEEHILAFEKI